MPDQTDNHVFAIEPLDLDRLYRNYLVTCRMSGVEPIARERADALIAEWHEVLSGRRQPTTH